MVEIRRPLRLGDLPGRAAALWGDRPALVFEGRRWTHAEFAGDVDRVAKGLIAAGIEPGDHVAVWMTNRPEWLHLMYAVARVGGCIVPLNTRYRSDDVAYTAAQSESVMMIVQDRSGPIDFAELMVAARPEIEAAGFLRSVVMLGDTIEDSTSYGELLAAGATVSDEELEARSAAVDVGDRMMLAYTSGTTGHPKGVVHTHRPIANNVERAMLLGHTTRDVHMSYLPLFHLFGFGEVAMMAALTGASQVLFDVFDPGAVLDAVQSEGGTVLHGFDSHWSDLIAAHLDRERDVSSLRLGTLAAGMDSSTPVARRAQDMFCPTISGFGMSECWAFVCCSHPSHTLEQRTEASGYPMADVFVEIRDPETGEILGVDEPGALFVNSPTMMEGYWRKPEATGEVLDDDGWLDTGDMARMRGDGHVVFMGRHKDMLKVGGENVSPAEVEAYLKQADGVVEVAVVGYPDPRLVEVPVAYVITDGSVVDGDALIERCRGRIAGFKIPRHVVFVDEMPMTPSGKIRKVELRQMALDTLGDPRHA